jgi:hypothetical protein
MDFTVISSNYEQIIFGTKCAISADKTVEWGKEAGYA